MNYTPDRLESACGECLALADNPTPTDKDRQIAAGHLVWLPFTHPQRWIEVVRDGRTVMTDAVLDMSERIRAGQATPDELRAFVVELRKGAPEMAATGWYRTLYSGGL